MRTLAELEREAVACTKCPLAQGRTQVVFGVGNPAADLMFVGEAPGREEDLKGEPFVGRSGKLLDRLVLEEMGLTRDEFYIGNVLKCLRYTAMVQLGDGSWERVGRLVRSRYDGTVMSITRDGLIEPRRVIGWHASPLGNRRVYKMTYRSAKRAGAFRVAIQLTGDHPVLTDEGYVRVDQLSEDSWVATGQGLSSVARDAVYGTILGDATLNRQSAHLAISHCVAQVDYVDLLADVLNELRPVVTTVLVVPKHGGPREPRLMLRTRAHRALRPVRTAFYTPTKHVPAWIADEINPRMLAFWFMDDGHTRIRPQRRPNAEIATCAFDTSDLTTLLLGLKRLGLEATVRGRNRINFGVDATERLSEVIAPYVPKALRYKLHPDVRARIPFQPELLKPGPPEVMYDRVEVEDITDQPRTDRTFFCIDVEETHNFVTAGGVVHNCRPPNNRDPQPDEIASCRPYLEEQLQIIDPRVIVTLGNFATKLLLDTTEGITKVRGRTYPYGAATLVPTYHPSAALQGGGTEVLARMRADLVRAKQILAGA
jgi:uracil-DNA glycosylase